MHNFKLQFLFIPFAFVLIAFIYNHYSTPQLKNINVAHRRSLQSMDSSDDDSSSSRSGSISSIGRARRSSTASSMPEEEDDAVDIRHKLAIPSVQWVQKQQLQPAGPPGRATTKNVLAIPWSTKMASDLFIQLLNKEIKVVRIDEVAKMTDRICNEDLYMDVTKPFSVLEIADNAIEIPSKSIISASASASASVQKGSDSGQFFGEYYLCEKRRHKPRSGSTGSSASASASASSSPRSGTDSSLQSPRSSATTDTGAASSPKSSSSSAAGKFSVAAALHKLGGAVSGKGSKIKSKFEEKVLTGDLYQVIARVQVLSATTTTADAIAQLDWDLRTSTSPHSFGVSIISNAGEAKKAKSVLASLTTTGTTTTTKPKLNPKQLIIIRTKFGVPYAEGAPCYPSNNHIWMTKQSFVYRQPQRSSRSGDVDGGETETETGTESKDEALVIDPVWKGTLTGNVFGNFYLCQEFELPASAAKRSENLRWSVQQFAVRQQQQQQQQQPQPQRKEFQYFKVVAQLRPTLCSPLFAYNFQLAHPPTPTDLFEDIQHQLRKHSRLETIIINCMLFGNDLQLRSVSNGDSGDGDGSGSAIGSATDAAAVMDADAVAARLVSGAPCNADLGREVARFRWMPEYESLDVVSLAREYGALDKVSSTIVQRGDAKSRERAKAAADKIAARKAFLDKIRAIQNGDSAIQETEGEVSFFICSSAASALDTDADTDADTDPGTFSAADGSRSRRGSLGGHSSSSIIVLPLEIVAHSGFRKARPDALDGKNRDKFVAVLDYDGLDEKAGGYSVITLKFSSINTAAATAAAAVAAKKSILRQIIVQWFCADATAAATAEHSMSYSNTPFNLIYVYERGKDFKFQGVNSESTLTALGCTPNKVKVWIERTERSQILAGIMFSL